MDFIDPVSIKAGTCTPSISQNNNGCGGVDEHIEISEVDPTIKTEGCLSSPPSKNEAPLGSLKNYYY